MLVLSTETKCRPIKKIRLQTFYYLFHSLYALYLHTKCVVLEELNFLKPFSMQLLSFTENSLFIFRNDFRTPSHLPGYIRNVLTFFLGIEESPQLNKRNSWTLIDKWFFNSSPFNTLLRRFAIWDAHFSTYYKGSLFGVTSKTSSICFQFENNFA